MSEKLTREECDNALADLFENHDRYLNSSRKPLLIMEKLIKEHFDNPPLKLEELEYGEAYWSKSTGWFLMNDYQTPDGKMHYEAVLNDEVIDLEKIKENRFYRKRVEE